MANIKISADDFGLTSNWTVSGGVITQGPTTSVRSVNFDYGGSLPADAKIRRARVHSTWGSPLSGYAIRTVNGVKPDSDGMVDVVIDPTQSSINVQFRFKANGNKTSDGSHVAGASVSDVYLLIETGGVGYVYRAEGGELVPYQLCRVEGGALVPYQLCKAEGGELVPY